MREEVGAAGEEMSKFSVVHPPIFLRMLLHKDLQLPFEYLSSPNSAKIPLRHLLWSLQQLMAESSFRIQ